MTRAVSDERIVEAINDALDAGDRDLLAGGVVATDLADRLPIQPDRINYHLTRLDDAGKLATVHGADPETYQPRQSYLPADHSDAGTPDEDY